MYEVVVFDCDGTLVDSGAMIVAAMRHAFSAADREPPPDDAVRQIIGLSLGEAIRALAPDAPPRHHAALERRYRVSFATLRADPRYDEPLFPGIEALLRDLDANGRRLAIATGKSRRGLEHLLATHALGERFVSIQTADGHPSKPHPAMLRAAIAEAGGLPEEACMIGDTTYDIEMAAHAGVAAFGVAWGSHAPDRLRAAGAAAVAADVGDLRAMLRA